MNKNAIYIISGILVALNSFGQELESSIQDIIRNYDNDTKELILIHTSGDSRKLIEKILFLEKEISLSQEEQIQIKEILKSIENELNRSSQPWLMK